ncbi:MAG: phoR, partial [Rhizobacter sp.]|nr:phoR [Rhizobacter sp.]
LGAFLQLEVFGGIVGSVIGAAIVVARDSLGGLRLMEWLRGSQEKAAPRDAGFWGEMGYRVERQLRLRDRAVSVEQERLAQFMGGIEASPNGVMLLDTREQIEWVSAVAADHFGLDRERDRRQRVTNLVRAPAFVKYLQAGDYAEPVVFNGPNGRGLLSVVVRWHGDGMKLVLSQDVTERERAEGMRREFVANVSHEIRTPLTVLSGFIETMAHLPLTEPERRRVLELMEQQAHRMQTLVADLLTLAQLEGSPRPSADRWVSLDKVIGRALSDATALSAGRHELSFDTESGVEIAGLENELLSAVGNLVSNAVRYTPDGGEISVRWHALPNQCGELVVSDTGIGIAREHIPRLTERFYRVDGSRSRDTGGTGLGLSIVKHVVQRHGGALEVTSEMGRGSAFRLVFPALRIRVAHAVGTDEPVNDTVDAS